VRVPEDLQRLSLKRVMRAGDGHSLREVLTVGSVWWFTSIPHDRLMACVRMRVGDRSVLKRIRMWLETPVYDSGAEGGAGEKGGRSAQGTPQGGAVCP